MTCRCKLDIAFFSDGLASRPAIAPSPHSAPRNWPDSLRKATPRFVQICSRGWSGDVRRRMSDPRFATGSGVKKGALVWTFRVDDAGLLARLLQFLGRSNSWPRGWRLTLAAAFVLLATAIRLMLLA